MKSIIFISFNESLEKEQMFHLTVTKEKHLEIVITDDEGVIDLETLHVDASQVKHFVEELNRLVNE